MSEDFYSAPAILSYEEAADLGKWLDTVGIRAGDEDGWQPEIWNVHGVHVEIDNGRLIAGRWYYSEHLKGDVHLRGFVQISVAMEIQKQNPHIRKSCGYIADQIFGKVY